MTTLAPSFLIGSSLVLQVMRTTIKSWMPDGWVGNSARSDLGPWSLVPLSVWKNTHRLIMGEMS